MTEASGQPEVYFDDVRAALSFALNFEGDSKAPVMWTMLARVRAAPKPVTKRAQKIIDRALKGFDAQSRELALKLIQRQFAEAGTRKTTLGPPPLRGLDASHMAGYILATFQRLDHKHQVLLRGSVLRAYAPCSCGAPCCSGRRRNGRWAEAVRQTAELLREAGEIVKGSGKRGLSTPPEMRLALIEQYYTKSAVGLEEFAAIGRVSTATAARHKAWVQEWMEQTEDEAWLALAPIFDEAGVTGARW